MITLYDFNCSNRKAPHERGLGVKDEVATIGDSLLNEDLMHRSMKEEKRAKQEEILTPLQIIPQQIDHPNR